VAKMQFTKGQKVIYKPGVKKRGFSQPSKEAVVMMFYPDIMKVRIKCAGETAHRNIKAKYVEVISG
jgi:hypothetical protein